MDVLFPYGSISHLGGRSVGTVPAQHAQSRQNPIATRKKLNLSEWILKIMGTSADNAAASSHQFWGHVQKPWLLVM